VAANEAFERVASIGLMPNMILYLTRVYGMQIATAANVLFLWSAASNFMPILGAFLADSYVGRYRMIGFGSIVSLLVNFSIQFHFFLTLFINFFTVFKDSFVPYN
jgi:peptide/histidine transporter 3/4